MLENGRKYGHERVMMKALHTFLAGRCLRVFTFLKIPSNVKGELIYVEIVHVHAQCIDKFSLRTHSNFVKPIEVELETNDEEGSSRFV